MPEEVKKAEEQQVQTPAPKTFTQEQVDEFVTKRLARERAQTYKTLGIEDESKLPDVIEKIKKYDTIFPEYESMKKSAAEAEYKRVLATAGIDEAFIEYALGKVDKGKDIDAYKANADAFVKANPKMVKEQFQQRQGSGADLGGNGQLPDFNKMTDSEFIIWRKTHNLDGTAKK